jgi:hypothetical protein
MGQMASAILLSAMMLLASTNAWAGGSSASMPEAGAAAVITLRGKVTAVDQEKKTVTVTGAKGRKVTLDVKDPAKLAVIKVGDPVVAKYVEALTIRAVKGSGGGTPSVTAEAMRVSSRPGEPPAGMVARDVTVTATISAIDTKAGTVTLTGPKGNKDTIKVKDPQVLSSVSKGDTVEVTYAQALAVALDRTAK